MDIAVTIKGISPLLMNRFTERAELAVQNGTALVQLGQKPSPREQAEEKAYKDSAGKLIMPGQNLAAALVAAGRFHKVGRSKVTTAKTSLVPAGIWIRELAVPVEAKKIEVDSRSVVIPATGGRVMCHRPRLDEWAVSFTLDVDTTLFSTGLVRALVDDAGKKIGLGDFRPERKGPFGRFVVTRWTERKDG